MSKTITLVPPRYIEEGQVTHAVWEAPITQNVMHIPGLWQRAVGIAWFEEHAEHTKEYGWLLDYDEVPVYPRPGNRRMYFESIACFDCLTTYASVPRDATL